LLRKRGRTISVYTNFTIFYVTKLPCMFLL
jgi:hypothetical protein